MRKTARKLMAVAGLFALLLSGVSALAESLSAIEQAACCNTVYCPVHHRQGRDLQKDKSNCDAQRNPMRNDRSMRACETTLNPAVGTAPFVLTTPVAIQYQASADPTPIQASQFSPFALSLPSTPPPRTIPS